MIFVYRQGYLTAAEKSARRLDDGEGNIDKGGLVNVIQMNKKLKKMVTILVVLVCFLFVGLIAVGVGLGVQSSSTGKSTQAKIEESVPTGVELDQYGHAYITDPKTGQELSARANGDKFLATTKFHPISGRHLICMSIEDTAAMFNDAVSRTDASVTFVDENGNDYQVLPVGGRFVDKGHTLNFGKGEDSIQVVMDSDACNTALDVAPSDPQDVQDEDGDEVSESDARSNFFNRRGLRHPVAARASTTLVAVDRPQTKPSSEEILARNRDAFAKAKIAVREGRKLEGEGTSVPITIGLEDGFVGSLTCVNRYVDGSNLLDTAIDAIFKPLERSPLDGLEGSEGEGYSLVSIMKEELNDVLSNMDAPSILLPQKVCADAEEDVSTRGGNAGVEACEALDMLGNTDVFAFGYHDSVTEKGFCVALHDGTQTYALGQSGILPPIKIQALTITLDAIAVSLTKALSATTVNTMWDGTASPEELTINGHFALRGTGSMGLKLSSVVDMTLSCDTTVLVDLDYNNNVSCVLVFCPCHGRISLTIYHLNFNVAHDVFSSCHTGCGTFQWGSRFCHVALWINHASF